MLTDWGKLMVWNSIVNTLTRFAGHNSAFQAIWPKPYPKGPPIGLGIQSTLLNGKGNVTRYNFNQKNTSAIPEPYNLTVSSPGRDGRPKRYLLRLINISFESMFVFSVDYHQLTVVSTDFVSIHPYNTTSVRIGIGQRYNVVLTAQPVDAIPARSFWIRAYRPACFNSNKPPEVVPTQGYEKAGILYYDKVASLPDEKAEPWPVDQVCCNDEPHAALKPIVPWQVSNKSTKTEDSLNVNLGFDNRPLPFPLAGFSIGGANYNPLRINYSTPLILNLTWEGPWYKEWAVYPEDYTSKDWVRHSRISICCLIAVKRNSRIFVTVPEPV
jgi:hypothetical protein